MNDKNKILLAITIFLIVGSIYYLDSKSPNHQVVSVPVVLPSGESNPDLENESFEARQKEKQKKFPVAKELIDPTGFINTKDGKPITIQELISKKVILLDIWTYSCINCQRTIPYLKSWYSKYKDQGLEIVALHVPEFEFEKDYSNVTSAVKKFGITYPVVLDSNGVTARSYGMRYWPEEYLIDIDGFIVEKSIGEGAYGEKEAKIVELLNERNKVLGIEGIIKISETKVENTTTAQSDSPETYFGSRRNQNFENGKPGTTGIQVLSLPEKIKPNLLYLGGTWNINNEYALNQGKGDSIVFKYKSKEVYFVASSKNGVKIKIYQDGVLLKNNRGEDVDQNGEVLIKEERLYKLINNSNMEEHTLKIEIEGAGLEAYTFTFG